MVNLEREEGEGEGDNPALYPHPPTSPLSLAATTATATATTTTSSRAVGGVVRVGVPSPPALPPPPLGGWGRWGAGVEGGAAGSWVGGALCPCAERPGRGRERQCTAWMRGGRVGCGGRREGEVLPLLLLLLLLRPLHQVLARKRTPLRCLSLTMRCSSEMGSSEMAGRGGGVVVGGPPFSVFSPFACMLVLNVSFANKATGCGRGDFLTSNNN